MPQNSSERSPKSGAASSAGAEALIAESGGAEDSGAIDAMAAVPEDAPAPKLDKVGILGHVVWLMTQSPLHKHVFLADLEWLVMPPLALNQFRIWHGPAQQVAGIPASQVDGARMPIGYASWAYLDEEAEARIKTGIKHLRPTDWKVGNSLWLIDMVMPFGGSEKAVQELKEKVFKGQTVRSLQPSPSGEGVAVMEW